jgi:DNA processing protein
LLARFDGPGGLLNAPASLLESAGCTPASIAALRERDLAALRAAEDWAAQQDHHVLTWHDDDYPALLREIPDPPVVLFLRGRRGVPELPQLAIVGSRNATPGGADIARAFSAALGRAGFCITAAWRTASTPQRTPRRWTPAPRRWRCAGPDRTSSIRKPTGASRTGSPVPARC